MSTPKGFSREMLLRMIESSEEYKKEVKRLDEEFNKEMTRITTRVHGKQVK